MKKVILTKGLPASGKSTWAKKMVDKGGYKRINKDDLRAMLDNSHYTKHNEKFIEKMRDLLILEVLNEGFTPIVDDTNLAPRHYNHISELVKEIAEIKIEDKFLQVSLEECIKRDLKRPVSVGEKVIRDMYNQFIKPKEEPYSGIGLPEAIICDIDGTLTSKSDRGWYDWSKVGSDKVNNTIANILLTYRLLGIKIIIVSGRDGVCYDSTKQWLEDNKIFHDLLLMRTQDDNRKDAIVKRELFDEYIRDKYNILFVLDVS